MYRPLLLACVLALGSAQLAVAQEVIDDYAMVHVDDRREPYRYVPDNIVVRPGARIELMIFGDSEFSIVSVDGAWKDVVATSEGEFGSVEFRAPLTPGTYRFYDKFTATPTTKSGEGLVGTMVIPEGAAPVPSAQAESSAVGVLGLVALVAGLAVTMARRAS